MREAAVAAGAGAVAAGAVAAGTAAAGAPAAAAVPSAGTDADADVGTGSRGGSTGSFISMAVESVTFET